MKKIILFAAFFLLVFVHEGFAFLRVKGALTNNKDIFYFAGTDIFLWSGYKTEYRPKGNSIYKYNFANKRKEIIYSGNCLHGELSLSNNYITGICAKENYFKTLVLFNTKGEKLLEISDSVQEHAWYPDGTKLIYMTGEKKYKGGSAFEPTGIWLYDIEKKSKKKIADKGWNVRNVSFDKHIYFWNGKKTVRYNVDNEKIEETEIKEKAGASKADYSPNGRYYLYGLDVESRQSWWKPYWGPMRIYDTKENKDLPPEKVVFMSERNAGKRIWGKDSRIIAFEGNISRTDGKRALYFYDLETSKVLKQFKGKIVGFDKDRTVLVIYRDGEFYLEKFPY